MRSVARGQDCDGDAAPSCSAALGVGALPHGSVLQARGASEGIADREAESLVEGDVGRIRCLQVARETCLVGAFDTPIGVFVPYRSHRGSPGSAPTHRRGAMGESFLLGLLGPDLGALPAPPGEPSGSPSYWGRQSLVGDRGRAVPQ